MVEIVRKEFNGFFDSLTGYLAILIFLLAIGLFMWVLPGDNVLDNGFAELEVLFAIGPYVFMFLIPAITMRSFAEEKKTGTIELLFTRPISDTAIILGKFFAGYGIVFFSLLPTLIYYYSIYQLGSPKGNLDSAGIIGSYIGLFLLGGVFTALGIFASSISENQIVAFITAVFFTYLFYTGFSALSTLNGWGKYAATIDKLGIAFHYTSISRGLIDSSDLIYFCSVIGITLSGTYLVLSSRRW